MENRFRVFVVVVVCFALTGVCLVWFVWGGARSDESLFDTDLLVVEGLTWQVSGECCMVKGRLVNHGRRAVTSAVVVLEMCDERGNVIATNPMVEVLSVPANSDRPFGGRLNMPGEERSFTITASVAAARWE